MHEQVDPRLRERHLSVEKKQRQVEHAVERVQEESRRPRSFAFRELPEKPRRVPETGLPERAELLPGHGQVHGELQLQHSEKTFTW